MSEKVKKKIISDNLFYNIVHYENSVLVSPNAIDAQCLFFLYQEAIGFYRDLNKPKLIEAFEKKIEVLLKYNDIQTLISKYSVYSLYRPKEKCIKVLVRKYEKEEKQKEENDFHTKVKNIVENYFENDEKKINSLCKSCINKQKNSFRRELEFKRKKKRKNSIDVQAKSSGTKLPQITTHQVTQSLNINNISNISYFGGSPLHNLNNQNRKRSLQPVFTFKNTLQKKKKMNIHDMFGNNFDKINFICHNIYNTKLKKIINIYNEIYQEKISIAVDHIKVIKELNLLQSPEDKENEKTVELMKESMDLETEKKLKKLIEAKASDLEELKKIYSEEELLEEEKIDEYNSTIFENVVNVISI